MRNLGQLFTLSAPTRQTTRLSESSLGKCGCEKRRVATFSVSTKPIHMNTKPHAAQLAAICECLKIALCFPPELGCISVHYSSQSGGMSVNFFEGTANGGSNFNSSWQTSAHCHSLPNSFDYIPGVLRAFLAEHCKGYDCDAAQK